MASYTPGMSSANRDETSLDLLPVSLLIAQPLTIDSLPPELLLAILEVGANARKKKRPKILTEASHVSEDYQLGVAEMESSSEHPHVGKSGGNYAGKCLQAT